MRAANRQPSGIVTYVWGKHSISCGYAFFIGSVLSVQYHYARPLMWRRCISLADASRESNFAKFRDLTLYSLRYAIGAWHQTSAPTLICCAVINARSPKFAGACVSTGSNSTGISTDSRARRVTTCVAYAIISG